MDRNFKAYRCNIAQVKVALRKESVDRNKDAGGTESIYNESLSARRAWIEIISTNQPAHSSQVALRKESVDRNVIGRVVALDVLLSLSARRAWIEILKKSA